MSSPPKHRPVEPAGDAPGATDGLSFDDLYEHAPCGYLSLDGAGTIVRVNQTFLEWTGMAAGDLLGVRRFSELLTMGSRVYYETHCAPLLLTDGEVREVALDVRRSDSSRLPIVFGARRQTGPSGEEVVRVTAFDASHRRSYERVLLAERDAARQASSRSELTAQLTSRMADLASSAEIDAALVAALVDAGIVDDAEVVRSMAGLVGGDAGFSPAGTTGSLPLLSGAGQRLATLRVESRTAIDEADRAVLLTVAELAGRALERAQRLTAMQRRARSGDVTGLPNRRWWQATLDGELRDAQRSGHPLTLLVIELDDFARYGQRHGHVAGDKLLLAVVDAFRRVGLDLLSREGGEEFAAVVAGPEERDMRRMLSDVRRNPGVRSVFSAGIAQWDGEESAGQLVLRAEAALADERRELAARR